MKMASKKQQYACAWIHTVVNKTGSALVLDPKSEDFAESLTAQEAFLYIKEHEDVYADIRRIQKADSKREKQNRVNHHKRHYHPDNADNAYGVTDWLDCFDLGIFPWGNS